MVTRRAGDNSGPVIGAAAVSMSTAVVLVAAVGGVWTVWNPGLLKGPVVMDGSARDTALILLSLALPALVVSMLAGPGAYEAVITWFSALLFVAYNSVWLLFMTPLNAAFPGGATGLIRFRLWPPLMWSCRFLGLAVVGLIPVSDAAEVRRVARPGRSPGLSETPRRHPLGGVVGPVRVVNRTIEDPGRDAGCVVWI
jgi:hypothetical protein